jgi:hypothetical protein
LVEPTSTPEPEIRILFIGNSLTFWNNGLGYHLEQLVESSNLPLSFQTESVIKLGASLKTLWEETTAQDMIADGDFDFVVLQGKLPYPDLNTFNEYTSKFVGEIRETGAEPVLFMTWSRSGVNTEEIAQAYADLAEELEVVVAPVGIAWQQAMEEKPALDLYDQDLVHPNIQGTFLTVNVLYGTIFGESPVGLTYLPSEEFNMTEAEAAFLQRIAWETVETYQPQP